MNSKSIKNKKRNKNININLDDNIECYIEEED